MHASKLVQILKTFSPADWSALQLMAASPYFLTGRDAEKVQQLIILIKQAHPSYTQEQLKKEKIAAKIFAEQGSTQQLPKVMSKLMRLVETHLLQEQQNNTDKNTRQLQLAKVWEARGLKSLAQQSLAKAERQIQQSTLRGKAFYWQQLELAENWFTHYSSISLKELNNYLQQTGQKLDEWYLLAKLEQVVWLKAQRIQTKAAAVDSLVSVQTLLKQLEQLDFKDYPVHGVFYHALLFLKAYHEADMEVFLEVGRQLEQHGHLLEANKVKALQTLLRIFATGRYNYGDEAYLAVSLALYQAHLAAGYLYFGGKIHSQTLLNMVTLGLRKHEFSWVEKLLDDHQSLILDQEAAPYAFRFNQALLAFYRGQLEQALIFLHDHYHNIYYRLAARRLEIMIYYEQQSVLLDAKMEAFKVYIFRLSQKQLPAKPKALNNNFIDILRQITHPTTLGNTKRRSRIREKIRDTDLLAEREWLLGLVK